MSEKKIDYHQLQWNELMDIAADGDDNQKLVVNVLISLANECEVEGFKNFGMDICQSLVCEMLEKDCFPEVTDFYK